jgi:hypothetical protein
MAHAYNENIRNGRMELIVTEAGTSALGKLYNGTRPAAGGELSGNTLIAEVTFASTLGTVDDGVLTMGTITGDSAANATGTPTFLRVFQDDGTTWVADFDTPGFPACTSGLTVDITGFTVTEGNAG